MTLYQLASTNGGVLQIDGITALQSSSVFLHFVLVSLDVQLQFNTLRSSGSIFLDSKLAQSRTWSVLRSLEW